MKKWIDAIKFVVMFISFAYIGGAALTFGAVSAAKMSGIAVAIAVDGGGDQ